MNSKVMGLLVLTVMALSLTGCFKLSTKVVDKLVDDEKTAVSRSYVQKLKDGQLDELADEILPLLKMERGVLLENLAEARGYLPAGTPTEIDVVSYRWNYNNGATTYQLVEQYDYGDRWTVTTIAWCELPNGDTQLQAFYVARLQQPLQELNALTLHGKTLRHYLFGAMVVIIPVFSFTTLIFCIRTKFERRKWLWILFILAGFGGVSLNWTTGQIEFQLLKITLLGSTAFTAGAFAPWVLTLSLPLGAICFWLRRKPQPPKTTPPIADQTAG